MWCVLDIETTGLDPKSDLILEVAAVGVDPKTLEVRDSWRTNILHPMPEIESRMGDFVRDMHTQNGLLQEISDKDGLPMREVDALLAGYLQMWGGKRADVVLIGNSIHFDRSFLAAHMRGVSRRLHHRMIDVSTLNTLASTWAPGSYEKPEPAHRALADCMSSLEQLKAHRARLWP